MSSHQTISMPSRHWRMQSGIDPYGVVATRKLVDGHCTRELGLSCTHDGYVHLNLKLPGANVGGPIHGADRVQEIQTFIERVATGESDAVANLGMDSLVFVDGTLHVFHFGAACLRIDNEALVRQWAQSVQALFAETVLRLSAAS